MIINKRTERSFYINISVVIPVYNEELHLNPLYERLTKTLLALNKPYEIIFIDDGSSDQSFKVLEDIHINDNRVKVIQFSRNFGQHPAVIAGFEAAKGDIIITMDADLQNPPEEIPKLIAKLEEGYAMVVGRRINRQDNWRRRLISRVGNVVVSKLMGVKLNDHGCMMRSYKKKVVKQVLKCPEKFKIVPTLIAWLAPLSVVEIDIKHDSRKYGRSKYKIYDLLRIAFDLTVGYTTFPLQIITLVGVFLAFAGTIGLLIIPVGYIMQAALSYFKILLVSGFLFCHGMLLFSIGLIGEYIGRTFVEVQKRPYYIVDRKLE